MGDSITNISPIDGRYESKTRELKEIFSEYGLIRFRILVELRWFLFQRDELNFFLLDHGKLNSFLSIFNDFNAEKAEKVKKIEKTTNHDVKAIEYYLNEELEKLGAGDLKDYVHWGLTSEDVTNNAIAFMLVSGRRVIMNFLEDLLEKIEELGFEYKNTPMMSHTHGQPASPTTVGKEFINFAWRLREQKNKLQEIEVQGKLNGASGNFNAHHLDRPEINWIKASRKFISEYLNLKPQIWSTQINNYSYVSEILHCLVRISCIIQDLNRDMWLYISIFYLKQKIKDGEVGSSTMPHKVNPIDFENSEGNIEIGIAVMEKMATKLLVSRMQRDLSDSTTLRNLGSCFAYLLIAIKSTLKGLGKIEINSQEIETQLENNWSLMAEPIQTVMRSEKITGGYDMLKALTRGRKINRKIIVDFIEELNLPEEKAERLKQGPYHYTGLAEKLVDEYFEAFS